MTENHTSPTSFDSVFSRVAYCIGMPNISFDAEFNGLQNGVKRFLAVDILPPKRIKILTYVCAHRHQPCTGLDRFRPILSPFRV